MNKNNCILNENFSINSLQDMNIKDLNRLCKEIREKIISVVSKNGGHLSSNLGVVELTVALHKSFNNLDDAIIWDVGHQCYTHKILTGRLNDIDSIRTEGGISGFPKRSESHYDVFNSGHSSTSISAGFGIANAKDISGKGGYVVSVIGDGALTGGLAYEGLNNAGRFNKNFIVVLNDNKMSISKNVGSIAGYLSEIRIRPIYLKIKHRSERILSKIPIIGNKFKKFLMNSKNVIKNVIYDGTLFEDMGFTYYGPIDGHDISKLTQVFDLAKRLERPVFIHVVTQKGKGYEYAEKKPNYYHATSSFNIKTGINEQLEKKEIREETFSNAFGKLICNLASSDKRICAITAAMKFGTGLEKFSKKFKNRFFDVGIAEEHAVTFASGLASAGMLPVFAVYSSFLQRSYDQIVHDAATQNLKVTLAIDRCGIVGEDGETHQGVFDVSFMNSIPNLTIFAPSYIEELSSTFYSALYDYNGVVAVRYPRGGNLFKANNFIPSYRNFDLYGSKNGDILIITYGRLFSFADLAMNRLREEGINISILKLNRIKPIDKQAIIEALKFKNIYFFEEGMKSGGIGEHFGLLLLENYFSGRYKLTAIDDKFIPQSTVLSALHSLGLDDDGMIRIIKEDYLERNSRSI